jgi:hypothetical protein
MEVINLDVPELEVDFYHKQLTPTEGVSKPIVVTASDGNEYFLKNESVRSDKDQSWTQFNADFFQELLVSHIARSLNINTPDVAIINITDELIEDYPDLKWNNHFNPGPHFATKKIENVQNNLLRNYEKAYLAGKTYTKRSWNSFFASINNKEIIPKIITLDLFTSNVDRFTNLNNILVSDTPTGRELISIDYGHCFFGPRYEIYPDANLNFNKIDTSNDVQLSHFTKSITDFYRRLAVQHAEGEHGLGIIFEELQKFIRFGGKSNDINPFDQIVAQVENYSDTILETYINAIPKEWIVGSAHQKNDYLNYLVRQKPLVRPLIEKFVKEKYFENYNENGDQLKWIKEKNMNIQ